MSNVIVIGAGPAGLMAAGTAAAGGAVHLFEKSSRPGRKLSLTGGGHGNITNTAELDEFIRRYRPDGRFLRQAFGRFFRDELTAFMEELSVATAAEPGGRVLPISGRAADVVQALRDWNRTQGVELRTAAAVHAVLISGSAVQGVIAGPDRQTFPADAVIIAAGGASYPDTGSDGDGFRLAEAAGHTIVPVRPALVPLETADPGLKGLQGVSLTGIRAALRVDDKTQRSLDGDVLFTHTGISGPAVLSLSGDAVDMLRAGRQVALSLDCIPADAPAAFDRRLVGVFAANGRKQVATLLRAFAPERLVQVCIQRAGIKAACTGSQVTADARRRLGGQLKSFLIPLSGSRPLAEAMVTAGGVSLAEVDPRTMESRLVRGLYFAGEVLDLDGDTGGFNLQAAFSTGWVAGQAAGGQG